MKNGNWFAPDGSALFFCGGRVGRQDAKVEILRPEKRLAQDDEIRQKRASAFAAKGAATAGCGSGEDSERRRLGRLALACLQDAGATGRLANLEIGAPIKRPASEGGPYFRRGRFGGCVCRGGLRLGSGRRGRGSIRGW